MMVGVEIAVRLYCLLPVEAYFSCRNVLFSQEIKKKLERFPGPDCLPTLFGTEWQPLEYLFLFETKDT